MSRWEQYGTAFMEGLRWSLERWWWWLLAGAVGAFLWAPPR